MADKQPRYPVGSQLQFPDGSLYVYLEACEDLEAGTYVEPSNVGRLQKFKGGPRFPKGIVMHTLPKDHYDFVMIRESQEARNVPAVERAAAPVIVK